MKISDKLKYINTLDGICLTQVKEQRDSGILVSHDLLPKSHISKIVKKANQKIGMIKHCFMNFTKNKEGTFIQPVFEYGSVIWNTNY